MQKNIALSFQPNFFRPLLYGIKKYEYRRSFCHEPVTAYLYLTKPVSQFIGILELGQRFSPFKIKEAYQDSPDICQKMAACIANNENAIIPIHRFRLFKHPLSLNELKHAGITFKVPRGFTYIDETPLLDYLTQQPTFPAAFYHDHSHLYLDNLGVKCSATEQTAEFKELDSRFRKSNKASLVTSGYLSKDK